MGSSRSLPWTPKKGAEEDVTGGESAHHSSFTLRPARARRDLILRFFVWGGPLSVLSRGTSTHNSKPVYTSLPPVTRKKGRRVVVSAKFFSTEADRRSRPHRRLVTPMRRGYYVAGGTKSRRRGCPRAISCRNLLSESASYALHAKRCGSSFPRGYCRILGRPSSLYAPKQMAYSTLPPHRIPGRTLT